jgi:hypothetical protein
MLGVLVQTPWLALLPAALFAAAYLVFRRRLMLIAAAAWLLYFLYEEAMRLRILCTGECNIRIDLLLVVYPLLALVSVAGLISAAPARRRRRRAEGARQPRTVDGGARGRKRG